MIPQEIIERLAEAPGNPFLLIEGAAQLAALTDTPLATPAAYVFVKEEAATPNERVNGVLQKIEMDIGVAIFVTNVSDATGAAAAADIDMLKRAVRTCLIGWQPASAEEPITDVAGQLVKARSGVICWEMTLGTAFYVMDEA